MFQLFFYLITRYLEVKNEKHVKIIDADKRELDKSLKLFSANVIASYSDLSGRITFTSDALCKISGFSRDELIGEPHNKLRHLDMSSALFKDLCSTIKSAKEWHGEVKNRKKDGGYY